MYFVYAVYNRKYNKIYIGQTKDFGTRLRLHKEHVFSNSFTAMFDGDWELIYKEAVEDRKQALSREKQLKSFRGREFVKRHIPR